MHPDEAHVWQLDPTRVAGRAALLSPEESARLAAHRDPRAGHTFLVARGLLRCALSEMEPEVAPAAWSFTRGPHGRPQIAAPRRHTSLRFNVSHTRDQVVCVVVRDADCGIDVEPAGRTVDVPLLAGDVLAPAEAAVLAAAAPEHRSEVFLRYWTLKEAYAKALGVGMRLPFAGLVFGPPTTGAPRLDPAVHPEGADWQFAQWVTARGPAGQGWVVSLALSRPGGRELRIVRHDRWPTCPPSPSRGGSVDASRAAGRPG
ncbi:4'-phosphopantetheinyl transferase superfamily protein [Streptomyces sp. SID1046]|nr:4'-phosphopantetheinyl transferase superfamily protein [Streptomyces sp. SID1046]